MHEHLSFTTSKINNFSISFRLYDDCPEGELHFPCLLRIKEWKAEETREADMNKSPST